MIVLGAVDRFSIFGENISTTYAESKHMSSVYEILKQDFAAARAAFVDADFHQMNICANRLMSNVLFGGDDSDAKYLAPGYFLRIIANDFLRIRDESIAKSVRQHAERFIGEIDRGFNDELNLLVIWNGFFEYTEGKRDFSKTPVERRVYKDNRTFTARGLCFLSRKLFDDPFRSGHESILLRALITEADRLIRNHGADNKELVLFTLFTALDWLDRYFAIALSDAEKHGTAERVKDEINSYLKRINDWYSASEGPPYKDATSILCDILLGWRKYFLRYMEQSKVSAIEERRVELPGQVRQRIGETIAQALQKDVSQKGLKGKKR
jgi:hypothetical protein